MLTGKSFDMGRQLGKEDAEQGFASDILAAWNALYKRVEIDLNEFAMGYIQGSKMDEKQWLIELKRINRFTFCPYQSCECHGMTKEEIREKYRNDVTKFYW